MMPVASATMPAANQTTTQIYSSEMPTESAARWLSATARSARPMRVFWKKMRERGDHHRRDDRGRDVDLLHCTKPPKAGIDRQPLGSSSCSEIMTFGSPPKISSPAPIRK